MMDKSLLDTDILSEVMRAVNHDVLANAADYLSEHRRYTLSTVTVMEVVKGFHRTRQQQRISRFLTGLQSACDMTSRS